jgi:hypothetical protein
MRRILPLLILSTAGFVAAQDGVVAGPTAGFVFDSGSAALRPIRGIPGASILGDPVNFGFGIANAYVAPSQDSAIVIGADSSVHIFRISADAVTERTVSGIAAPPDAVAFSPSGTSVALSIGGKIQVVTGLPDAPSVGNALDPGSAVTAMAASDDGAYVLFATGGSVKVLGAAGDVRTVASVGSGALVAFARGGHDGAFSDPSGAGLVFVKDLAGAATPTVVAAPDDGTASPVGLAFSADASKLYLASAAAQAVVSFSMASGKRTGFACNCTPAGLSPMGSLLRLNEVGGAPVWMLDSGADTPRIVFVPALAAAASNQ